MLPDAHRSRARRLASSTLAAMLVVGACGSTPATTPADVASVDPAVFGAGTTEQAAAPAKSPAVTHLGRELLPRAGLVVRGRTLSVSRALGGVEVARVQVDEVLRSVPWDRAPEPPEEPILTVFCGEPGMLPRAGDEAVLLVARRPRSPNHDVVQVVDVSDRDGPQRLEALREYLAIEEVPDEDERVDALHAYLRRAVRDSRKWTRSNAAREYGSLAKARPRDLGRDDAAVLRSAVPRAGERDVRIALQNALEVAERNTRAAPVEAATARATERNTGRLDPYLERFLSADDPLARRQVALDAALALGDDATPLLRRALADDDARVREAAVAAAGQLRLRTLGPDLVPMLAGEEPLAVRRSLVRALGYVREPSAVATLRALARDRGDMGEAACYALARIRDESSVAALGDLLGDATGTRRELLEFLLSDAFVDQEASLGRPLD